MTDTLTPTIEQAEHVLSLPLAVLAAHPDNVRRDLGDLSDLTRSVKASGVIVPLLALPANNDGLHLVVAGNRRLAAARHAGLVTAPVIVRDLSPVEVLDAMLTENGQRSDLTLVDSIIAVARYQVLAPKAGAASVARRIGRSQAWVKTRLALAVLPVDVLDQLGAGTLTIPKAEAVAALASEGDEVMRAAAEVVAANRWNDPTEVIARWQAEAKAEAQYQLVVGKLDKAGVRRFATVADARAAGAVPVGYAGLGLDKDQARAHRHEPCHAVCVTRTTWNNQVEAVAYCTSPKRHRATASAAAASGIAVDRFHEASTRQQSEDERDRKHARATRIAAASEWLTAGRTPPKPDTVMLAAVALTHLAGSNATKLAADLLGIDTTTPATTGYHGADEPLRVWLTQGGDPHRLIVAIVGADLETWGRQVDGLPQGHRATASAAWLDLLVSRAGYDASAGNDIGAR